MTDPIADFLTRIRNAQMARKSLVLAPYSKLKHHIAEVMQKNGFLKSVEKNESNPKKPLLQVETTDKKLNLTRVSKGGQRIYVAADDIRRVLNGYGIAIISTSQGVMTGYEARQKHIGGEILCEVS